MKCIAGEVAAIFGALSPSESGTDISVSESAHANRSQLFGLREPPLVAIETEPPDPMKVDDNRSGCKTTLSPQADDRALAVVDHLHQILHATSDGRKEAGIITTLMSHSPCSTDLPAKPSG